MMSNHCLARAIGDLGMAELRRQIEYKAAWNGVRVLFADRFYPSSKTCSACGHIKADLTLADRTYVCEACGMILDRDVNAAVNLAAQAG
jgi:putative transposase